MFEEYQNKVLLAYKNDIAAGKFLHLLAISPAMLREECLTIFRERYKPDKDDLFLRTFFGADEKAKGYFKIIDDYPTDKFRPMVKFFRKEIAKPDRKNIELLAWLIDFEPRPYTVSSDMYEVSPPIKNTENTDKLDLDGFKSSVSDFPILSDNDSIEKKTSFNELISDNSNTEKTKEKLPPPPKSYRSIFLITLIILFVEAGSFFLWRNYTDRISAPQDDEKCMYWAGTHYEPINCNQQKNDIPVIPLDVKKLNTLKKIYFSDTLTGKSLGKIWYSGYGKRQHEYFTDSGMHPVDTLKRLRPLTPYILARYVSYPRYVLSTVVVIACSVGLAILLALLFIYLKKRVFAKA